MKITKDINNAIFREYDVRGIYGDDLNEDVAYTVGKAFGSYVRELGESKVILGHDNRDSHHELYPALMQGILDSGVNVLSLGLVTTPMHNFAKIYYDVNAGIMVTASHNPKEYNGFKMSVKKEDSLYGRDLQAFKHYLDCYDFKSGKGTVINEDVFPAYFSNLKKSLNFGKRKIKVVVDCGNGTGSVFIENILKEFNIEYELLYSESDSNFPNHIPDPAVKANLHDLGEKVKELGYDLGVAVDGDTDRCGLVLEDGTFVSADMIMILFYRDLAEHMEVKKGVFDVKCSMSLIDEIKKLGFGLMRLPMKGDVIDPEQTKAMVDRFMEEGFIIVTIEYYLGIVPALFEERAPGPKPNSPLTELSESRFSMSKERRAKEEKSQFPPVRGGK